MSEDLNNEKEIIEAEIVEEEIMDSEVEEIEEVEEVEVSKEPYYQKLKMEDNLITGMINNYLISGIVYSDNTLVVSIPVKREVSQEIIDRVEYPSFVSDVRYQNGKVDLLSNVSDFRIMDGEEALELLTLELEKENLESNIFYQENRIEKTKQFPLKVLGVFAINLFIGIILSMFIFELQLGQILKSTDGSWYVYYYVPFLFMAISLLLNSLNSQLFKAFKIGNRYNVKSANKADWINFAIITVVMLLVYLFYSGYNAFRLFEIPLSYSLIHSFELVFDFISLGEGADEVFIMNFFFIGLAIVALFFKTYSAVKSRKRLNY